MENRQTQQYDSQSSAPQLLQAQLQKEISSREALLGCLSAERKALQQHDHSALARFADEKQRILQELEALAHSRHSMVADLPGLRRTLLPLAASSEDARRICAYCECLESLAADIVRNKEVNARLNARGQQIIRRLLAVLRGPGAAGRLTS